MITGLWQNYFEALRKQEWKNAINTLETLKKAEPANPHVYLRVGDVLKRLDRLREAVVAYHEAAHLFSRQGFPNKAIVIYKIILKIDPDDHEALTKSNKILFDLVEAGSEANKTEEFEMPTEANHGNVAYKYRPLKEPYEALSSFPVKSERHPPVFTSISPEENQKIIEAGRLLCYSPDQMIIEEGDMGDALYYIISGKATVISHILNKNIELAVLREGDIFGEIAFLTGRPRTASVTAETETEVMEIDKSTLENAIEKNPAILAELQDFYSQRIHDTIKKVLKK